MIIATVMIIRSVKMGNDFIDAHDVVVHQAVVIDHEPLADGRQRRGGPRSSNQYGVIEVMEKASTLDEAALRYLENASIPVFERALEEQLMKKAMLASVKDPHGVGVAIAYLYGKQNEITNLRIIVKGKAVGMPADRVREELILV